MKNKIAFLLTAAILIGTSICSAETTNTPLEGNIAHFAQATNIVWGAATNGVRAGLEIIKPGSYGNGYPLTSKCFLYFQNVGTTNATFRRRYKAKLLGEDGKPIELRPGKTIPVHGRTRDITLLRPKETSQIDAFPISEVFQLRTNGSHRLIVTVEAAPNRWHGKLTYFELPPMTNSFDMVTMAGSTNDASKSKQ